MLRLTDLLGRPVIGDAGALGATRDLSIRLSGHAVEAVEVGSRASSTLVAWSAVDPSSIGETRDRRSPLRVEGELPEPRELYDDELLVGRDVLDTQIVDVVGHRVNRVGDVLFEPEDGLLVPVGVEVGPASLIRRLGLRRSADRLAEHVVAWTDLHLTSARGHTVQLATSAAALHRLDAAGAGRAHRPPTPHPRRRCPGRRPTRTGRRGAGPLPSPRPPTTAAAAEHQRAGAAPLAPAAGMGPPPWSGPAAMTSPSPPLRSVRPGRSARRVSLLVLLGVLGPGLLAGLSDDDPAGITTYSALGAEHGYQLLWVLLSGHRRPGAVPRPRARGWGWSPARA